VCQHEVERRLVERDTEAAEELDEERREMAGLVDLGAPRKAERCLIGKIQLSNGKRGANGAIAMKPSRSRSRAGAPVVPDG